MKVGASSLMRNREKTSPPERADYYIIDGSRFDSCIASRDVECGYRRDLPKWLKELRVGFLQIGWDYYWGTVPCVKHSNPQSNSAFRHAGRKNRGTLNRGIDRGIRSRVLVPVEVVVR